MCITHYTFYSEGDMLFYNRLVNTVTVIPVNAVSPVNAVFSANTMIPVNTVIQ